jgi:hypothetical protein
MIGERRRRETYNELPETIDAGRGGNTLGRGRSVIGHGRAETSEIM